MTDLDLDSIRRRHDEDHEHDGGCDTLDLLDEVERLRAAEFDAWLAAERARIWDEGYRDGLRQEAEGDDGPRFTNPYRDHLPTRTRLPRGAPRQLPGRQVHTDARPGHRLDRGGIVTDIDIQAIRARAEAATPGPWDLVWDGQTLEVLGAGAIAGGGDVPVAEWLYPVSTTPPWRDEQRAECDTADPEFIAHAREDVPALLAEVERLRRIVKNQRDALDVWENTPESEVVRDLATQAARQKHRAERAEAQVQAVRALVAPQWRSVDHDRNALIDDIRAALDEHLGGDQ